MPVTQARSNSESHPGASQTCLQPCALGAGSVFLLICSHQCESSLPQGMVLRFMGIHYRHMVNFSSVHDYKRTFWGQHKKTSKTVDGKISWQHSGIIWPFQKTAIGLFHFVIGSNNNTKFLNSYKELRPWKLTSLNCKKATEPILRNT